MAPVLAFVPGFWEGTETYHKVLSLLSDFETVVCPLPSTGTTAPSNPSMHHDIAAIRKSVEVIVGQKQDVVMVMHSAGGFLGSNAIEGLSKKARAVENGLKGGVISIVFLTAGIYPEGFEHGDLPFGEIKDGALLCANAKDILYKDLEPAQAEEWVGRLKPQPASGWNGTVTYCAWRELPSVYLVCEGDQAIAPPIQMQLAEGAKSKIEICAGGHMLMLACQRKSRR